MVTITPDRMFILKSVCLFIGVFFTLVNLFKLFRGEGVSFINFFIQSLGITGFILI